MSKPKAAAICCINLETMKWAAVSLKDDKTDFGLPGGKLEDGGTFETAAIRELKEETGLSAEISDLELILFEVDEHGYDVRTYLLTKFTGTLASTENAALAWLPLDGLLQSKKYHNDNNKVYNILKSRGFN